MKYLYSKYLYLMTVVGLFLTAPLHSAPKPPPKVDLASDARLAQKLAFKGGVLPLGKVIEQVNEATEAEILVQGDLLRRPVTLAVKDKSCADLLEDLAVLFGGVWVRRKESYLLVTDEVTARLVGAYRETTHTNREELALYRTLTPFHYAEFRRSKRLTFDRMSPEQQRLVLWIVRDRYLQDPGQYPSSILTGKGVTLTPLFTTVEQPDGSYRVPPNGPYSVELEVPAISDDGVLTDAHIALIAVR